MRNPTVNITNDEVKHLDELRAKQQDGTRFFWGYDAEMLEYLQSKLYHNSCLNPRCAGYYAKWEDETVCPHCEHELHKLTKEKPVLP